MLEREPQMNNKHYTGYLRLHCSQFIAMNTVFYLESLSSSTFAFLFKIRKISYIMLQTFLFLIYFQHEKSEINSNPS